MSRKFALRFSRASGSTRAKIDKLIARGWNPSRSISDVLRRKPRRVLNGKGHA